MKLSAGDAVAGGGIVLAAFTVVSSTGIGMSAVLRTDPDDEDALAELRRVELAAAVVVLVGTAVMSGLMHEPWPLAVGLLAVGVAVGSHEAAFRDRTVAGLDPIPTS